MLQGLKSSRSAPNMSGRTRATWPAGAAVGIGTFPPLGGPSEGSPAASRPPRVDSTTAAPLRQRELGQAPTAPLPPAIVAGPIGIALAGWMAHRANRRGGRI